MIENIRNLLSLEEENVIKNKRNLFRLEKQLNCTAIKDNGNGDRNKTLLVS